MNPALIEFLRTGHDVKLVIDGFMVPLTIGAHASWTPEVKTGVDEPNIFRLEENKWQIRYNGRALIKKNLERFGYIHHLLKQPNVFVSAESLAIQTTGENIGSVSEKEYLEEGYQEIGLKVASERNEPIVSDEALRRIQASLLEMEEDYGRLKAAGEDALAFEKQQEIEVIKEYLKKAKYRGHVTRFADPAEKVRKRISVAIARGIADLNEEHPALARHLDNSIHTGRNCRYAPETEVRWVL